MRNLILLCLTVLMIFACRQKEDQALFVLRSAEETGLDFNNELPVDMDLNILNYMYYYNGGGLALADLNNDELIDVILSSNLGKEKLFLNKGDLKFEDISDLAAIDGGADSWTNGIAVADINHDGLMDVYLSQVGDYRSLDTNNKLFICTGINDEGIPSYVEKSAEWGLNFKGFSTQAGFFDYDLDGDLDMYLMNHSLHHNGTFGQRSEFLNSFDSISGDRLYRNDGEMFTDVSVESGINSSVIGYGLGLSFSDINNDGWPDIYVSNDFHENDYLYINQKDGTFKDELTSQMMHTSRFSMGVDIADINGDMHQDILTLDMLPEDPVILKASEGEDALDIFKFKLGYGYNHQYAKNALQLNTGRDAFQEVAMQAKVHATDWSWAPLIFDMDMDGNNDIFISNGIPKRMNDIDYINFISNSDVQYKIQFDQLTDNDLEVIQRIPEIKLFNKFYLNDQELNFKDLGSSILNDRISYSNSAMYADLDNDGDYDIICNNINDQAFIYENTINAKTLRISFEGADKNTNAIGAKLIFEVDGRKRIIERFSTRGFQSSGVDDVLISANLNIEEITVVWPDNRYEIIAVSDTADHLQLRYRSDLPQFNYSSLESTADFEITEIAADLGVKFKHIENPFVEFNRESLIPHATSSEGPALCVADFNGDDRDDIFIGSSKRKWSALFIQNPDGGFDKIGPVVIDSTYEEVDARAADLDGNGMLDLIIATGGNEFDLNSDYTRPLIIYNPTEDDSKQVMLDINLTSACVDLADIDNDGDMDIFFGARAYPRSYGADVRSYLMINEGNGSFTDLTETMTPSMSSIGMIKDAVFVDFDSDSDMDLLIAEEWGGIHLFRNSGNAFDHSVIVKDKALWNFIELIDLDKDGDLDIIAGNQGINSRLKASPSEPVRMYYNDFDDNGSHEQILSYYVNGKEIPFSNFKEILAQIPKLKKKYLFAYDFANASIQELFGEEKIRNSKVYKIDRSTSAVYMNQGDGSFMANELPYQFQMSPLKSVVVKDLNSDDLPDLIMSGNYYDCNIQMGRYDADYGSIAMNQGNGEFVYAKLTGDIIRNQVRNMESIDVSNSEHVVVLAKNNDSLSIIKINQVQ